MVEDSALLRCVHVEVAALQEQLVQTRFAQRRALLGQSLYAEHLVTSAIAGADSGQVRHGYCHFGDP